MELHIVEVQTNLDAALVMPGVAGLGPISAEAQAGRTRPQSRHHRSFLDCRATLAISCSVLRLLF